MGRSSAGLWLLLLLHAGPLVVRAQPAGCSCDSIRLVVKPACGLDGQWYQNECIAFCSGARVANTTDGCADTSAFAFTSGIGPVGAEGDAASTVNASVLTAFASEGYSYVGRVALAKELEPAVPDPEPYDAPEPDAAGNVVMRTVRGTPDGDVYVASMAIPAAVQAAVQAAAMKLVASPPAPPPPRTSGYGASRAAASARRPTRARAEPAARATETEQAARGTQTEQAARGTQTEQAARATQTEQAAPGAPTEQAAQTAAAMQAAQESGALWGADLDASRTRMGTLAAGGTVNIADASAGAGDAPPPVADASAGSSALLAARIPPRDDDADALPASISSLPPGSSTGGSSSFASIGGGGSDRRRTMRLARRLAEVIGSDDRTSCPLRKLPFSAVGQIEVVDPSGMFICTGTLIAADKVLTAGHCVWNINRGAFYFNLNFAPGRYRQGSGYVSPYGSIPWRSVTVFDAFKQNPKTWDVAVVTLSKPVGLVAGTVGLSTACLRNTKLTIAGYPKDRPRGSCTTSGCTVPVSACNAQLASHHCDTVQGMSGAPLWDSSNRIRLIHIAGSSARPVNQGTAMTSFLVNAVTKW